MVKLRDGGQELKSALYQTGASVKYLLRTEEGADAFFALVKACAEGRAVSREDRAEFHNVLLDGLFDGPNNQPSETVRRIISSAVQGKGVQIRLVNPVADDATSLDKSRVWDEVVSTYNAYLASAHDKAPGFGSR